MSGQAEIQVEALPSAFPRSGLLPVDGVLLTLVAALLGLGLVMVGSASVSIADRLSGNPFHFLIRQFAYVVVGLVLARQVVMVPLSYWQRTGMLWLLGGIALLVVVLIPGVGRTANGSTRWIGFGQYSLQISEYVKVMVIVYLASYLVRHGDDVRRTVSGFLKPMVLICGAAFLVLLEPDFGTAVVIIATAMGMLFLGGVRMWLFGVLLLLAVAAVAMLVIQEPYRLARLVAFTDPWADPFNSGFQLTQALIAFGRGEWLGVGLGSSVQKLFYLPEAHTDFLFAVLAEELGLIGVVAVILLFGFLVWRLFELGRAAILAGQEFGGYISFGVATWIGLQAFVNMGVNMGLLPTKGLTLPLMSYGGNSIWATCIALALIFRVDYELRHKAVLPRPTGRER